MEQFLKKIDGNKAYLVLIIASVIVILGHFGVITPETRELLLSLDAILLGGAVRSAMKKAEK